MEGASILSYSCLIQIYTCMNHSFFNQSLHRFGRISISVRHSLADGRKMDLEFILEFLNKKVLITFITFILLSINCSVGTGNPVSRVSCCYTLH